MDHYVWVSTRTIKPDTREQFEQSWRPAEFPDGLVGAYMLYAEGGNEVVGIWIWDSAEACDRYRRSDVEARRREAMDPFVVEERSSVYTGRELGIPGRRRPSSAPIGAGVLNRAAPAGLGPFDLGVE